MSENKRQHHRLSVTSFPPKPPPTSKFWNKTWNGETHSSSQVSRENSLQPPPPTPTRSTNEKPFGVGTTNITMCWDEVHNFESLSSGSDNSSDLTVNRNREETRQDRMLSRQDFSDLLFENILSEIRGMNVLSSHQMHYVRSLSQDKLCKIVELYNVVMNNVNEIL